jgi:hypothetical protein
LISPLVVVSRRAKVANFRVLKVDDDRAAFKEAWKYRVAVRRFQSAFAAVEGLAEHERQLILEQVADWLLRHMANVPSEEPKTAETAGIETSEAEAAGIETSEAECEPRQDDDSPEVA